MLLWGFEWCMLAAPVACAVKWSRGVPSVFLAGFAGTVIVGGGGEEVGRGACNSIIVYGYRVS